MAMSISIGQKLQPFTGNGDISMRVKNSKVEQIIIWSRVYILLKSFSSLGEFFTYDGNVTIVDERLLM